MTEAAREKAGKHVAEGLVRIEQLRLLIANYAMQGCKALQEEAASVLRDLENAQVEAERQLVNAIRREATALVPRAKQNISLTRD